VVTLHALLVRRADLTREQFLAHWHHVHGPFIRDTPALSRHLVRYEQHPVLEGRRGGTRGYDGVAVQSYRTWDDFAAMLAEPAAQAMAEDETRFLDRDKLVVVFSAEPRLMIGDQAVSG